MPELTTRVYRMRKGVDHAHRLRLREDGSPFSYDPHPEYQKLLERTQDGFPWGVVVSRQVVAGVEIVKSVDHMRPGRFTWHVKDASRSFDNEPDAILCAAMVAKGINVNHIWPAITMVRGLVPEEED